MSSAGHPPVSADSMMRSGQSRVPSTATSAACTPTVTRLPIPGGDPITDLQLEDAAGVRHDGHQRVVALEAVAGHAARDAVRCPVRCE